VRRQASPSWALAADCVDSVGPSVAAPRRSTRGLGLPRPKKSAARTPATKCLRRAAPEAPGRQVRRRAAVLWPAPAACKVWRPAVARGARAACRQLDLGPRSARRDARSRRDPAARRARETPHKRPQTRRAPAARSRGRAKTAVELGGRAVASPCEAAAASQAAKLGAPAGHTSGRRKPGSTGGLTGCARRGGAPSRPICPRG
jgi:hypothetical protein